MDYSFNAKTFRTLLHAAIADHFSEISAQTTDDSTTEETPEQLLAEMEQAIDMMERADADAAARQGEAVLSDVEITVYGAHWCPDCRRSKQFLGEHQIPYDWVDIEQDKEA